ncbi:hypothetical protein ABZ368_19875 [Streptomyces sp. NPDC005908]|uniref:hypothetical protein n=1 Tax=unclassified Streptomyces TaxID=2593676 RepID=UPI0011AE0D85|nr:hypothetical protein [Streptomyces sp. T12]TWD16392.1 hypothetical protein FB570_112276 [Streptomyces sp. T12]
MTRSKRRALVSAGLTGTCLTELSTAAQAEAVRCYASPRMSGCMSAAAPAPR